MQPQKILKGIRLKSVLCSFDQFTCLPKRNSAIDSTVKHLHQKGSVPVAKTFSSFNLHDGIVCIEGFVDASQIGSHLSILDNASGLGCSTDRLEKYGLRMHRKLQCTWGSVSVVKLWVCREIGRKTMACDNLCSGCRWFYIIPASGYEAHWEQNTDNTTV
jgi:hypothetical protein